MTDKPESLYFLFFFTEAWVQEGRTCLPTMVGVHQIHSWEIGEDHITTTTYADDGVRLGNGKRGYRHRLTFGQGHRFYIVENHGQVMEPNGYIIWKNVDGASGDEKVA